jgi:hypothetical protein
MTQPEQISLWKGTIWTLAIGGPIMSWWIYHDLSALATGAKESVDVWGPAATVYNAFGFWPAVACLPVLCLVVIGILAFRLEKAKSSAPPQDVAGDA